MEQEPCYPDKAPKVDRLLVDLSNALRREVILFFEDNPDRDTVSVDNIASHLDHRVPHMDRKGLRVELVHAHLPKLDEGGWIEFESTKEDVQYNGNKEAKRYLGEVADIFEG